MKTGPIALRLCSRITNRDKARLLLIWALVSRLCRSTCCLLLVNALLILVAIRSVAQHKSTQHGRSRTATADEDNGVQVAHEQLTFPATIEAAMEIFQFMHDTKTGKVGPKPLDLPPREISTKWCWLNPAKPTVERERNWQTVQEAFPAEIYLYASYYDDRYNPIFPDSSAIVHVLAMVRRKLSGQIFCQLWFSSSRRPFVVRALYREIWQRAWDPRNRFYGPWIISCPLRSQQVPAQVSLTVKPCSDATNVLEVRNHRPSNGNIDDKVVVCVKGMDFLQDNSLRMAEWLELQFLLGADKVVFYTYSVHPKTQKLIDHYRSSRKLLQVLLNFF